MKTNVKINGQTVEIELTQEQINQLKQATEPKSFKRWRAEHGEEYWIGAHGYRGVELEEEDGYELDDYCYAIGDYFKTEAEAEEYRKAMLKKQEIIDFIREKNEGWMPVFNCLFEAYIIVNTKEGFSVDCFQCTQCAPASYYFKSNEIGEELIEKFGNDLNYLFV